MESAKRSFREYVKYCWRCGHQIPTGSVCVICGTVNKYPHVPTQRETPDGDPVDGLGFQPNIQNDEAELEAIDPSEFCYRHHLGGSRVSYIQHVEFIFVVENHVSVHVPGIPLIECLFISKEPMPDIGSFQGDVYVI